MKEDFESNDVLKWDNLTGKEEYLPFSFEVKHGNKYFFDGTIQIPIRWK